MNLKQSIPKKSYSNKKTPRYSGGFSFTKLMKNLIFQIVLFFPALLYFDYEI